MARSILPHDVRTKMHLTHFKAVVDTEAARHRTRGEAAVGAANRRPRATEPRLADHDIRAMRGRCVDHDACAEHGLRTCPLRLTCRRSARARCGAHARAVAAHARRVDEPPRRGPWPLSNPPAHQHFRRSRMSRSVIVGFLLTLASAFFFAVSGPIAKTMYAIGWTPGSVVLI